VETNVVSCTRFACLLPVFLFLAMRVLSYAHPVPLPWTPGVFDAEGLDDILQTIRVAYVRSGDVRHVVPKLLATPTGCVAAWEPSVVRGVFLTSPQSRAPPRS
jgi:hypothetical protein